MKIKHLITAVIATLALFSCSTPKNITYFQDLPTETRIKMAEAQQIKLQTDDKIFIIVSTPDKDLTQLFNVYNAQTVGNSYNSYSNSDGGIGYTVDAKGDINFPILGVLHVAGMSRTEVADMIKQQLIAQDLVKDPTVLVEYRNLKVSIFGDVNSPGRYSINRDHYTILDALTDAGDLNITGLRENITVIRPSGDHQDVYKVNLCSENDIINSPAFYLHQGDYVYVEPNNMKKRSSTVNGNSMMTPSFWISIASFLSSMAVLVFK